MKTSTLALLATLSLSAAAHAVQDAPSFSLAWSEYPSWSVFGVAADRGLINPEKGKLGPLERRHNVDIELRQADYDPCLTMYASGTVDAVCITNMDVLNPALSRKSVMILPTSTSNGGDALVAVGVTDIKQLKRPREVKGLAKSVSEYAFVRGLQKLGENPADYVFSNADPAAAAQAMQQKQAGFEAIMVWNPFVLQTLRNRPDAKVIFDSSLIPGEIVDSVVVAREALSRPGGERFAAAVLDAFYEINRRMNDSRTADDTYKALGEKFSTLSAADMKTVCTQTKFYATPAEGIAALSEATLKPVMATVVEFCTTQQIIPKTPKLVWGAFNDAANADADLVFDPSFMQAALARAPKPPAGGKQPAAPASPAAPAEPKK